MIALAIILNAIAGALWRRWLGLGSSGPRWPKFAAAAPLTWPLFLVMPLGFAIEHAALVLLFFAPGHSVTDRSVWLRYGPFAAAYVLAFRYWPARFNRGRWLDGWMAAGELGLGASVFGALAAAGLLL